MLFGAALVLGADQLLGGALLFVAALIMCYNVGGALLSPKSNNFLLLLLWTLAFRTHDGREKSSSCILCLPNLSGPDYYLHAPA